MTNMEGFIILCIYLSIIFAPLIVLDFIAEVIIPRLPEKVKDFISGIIYLIIK